MLGLTRRALLLAARPKPPERFVGVTMMPEWIQTEGIDGVLKNLVDRAGVTAIATSPYVMEPAPDQTGSREPPIDADAGKVRLLDRPLFGRRELWVNTAPSFEHDFKLFDGLRYQPSPATPLTRKQGGIIKDFITEAQRRKVKVYFQVQAAIPPGYRVQFGGPADEDKPRLPDGRIAPRTLAKNGSLGSKAIRSYLLSLVRDILRVYPGINGIRLDWPEYPPYFLDDLFLDFSDHAAAAASRAGLRFPELRKDAREWYARLHGQLSNANVESEIAKFGRLQGGSWAALKRFMVAELLKETREVIDEVAPDCELVPNAFPPPFNAWSGITPSVAQPFSDGISVKLYTMHWPMMMRFYAEQLLKANPGLDDRKLVPALARWLDLSDEGTYRSLADCRYPEPDEPHNAGVKAQTAKLRSALLNKSNFATYGLAHGYGPLDDFRSRLDVAWKASARRIWINRYGYLSDAKLGVIKQVTNA